MPIDPNAEIEITAFRWVPEFAQGLVRDLRVRWALEEMGRPYRVRLLDATKPTCMAGAARCGELRHRREVLLRVGTEEIVEKLRNVLAPLA